LQARGASRDIRLKKSLHRTKTCTEPIPFSEKQTASTPAPDDLAVFHPKTSSSVDANTEYGSEAAKATDGNSSTYWRSQNSDVQWFAVDLSEVKSIDRFRLTWSADRYAASYAGEYAIQINSDGQLWTNLFSNADGQGGIETNRLPSISARWVRLAYKKRATNENYKIVSFEVFAPSK
jgi:hypothetical protein